MPIKLSASVCKKMPDQEQYSSKSYLASLEIELSSGLSSEQLNQEIHKTYAQLEKAVDEQINGQTINGSGHAEKAPQNGSSQPQKASNKQIKFILDLGKAREQALSDLNTEAGRLFGVDSIYDLSKKEASKFVDELKQAA
jgi:hypothetical protein